MQWSHDHLIQLSMHMRMSRKRFLIFIMFFFFASYSAIAKFSFLLYMHIDVIFSFALQNYKIVAIYILRRSEKLILNACVGLWIAIQSAFLSMPHSLCTCYENCKMIIVLFFSNGHWIHKKCTYCTFLTAYKCHISIICKLNCGSDGDSGCGGGEDDGSGPYINYKKKNFFFFSRKARKLSE